MNKWERLFKALANKRRLGIIVALSRHQELTVAEIAEGMRLSFKATSRHLQILKMRDIIESEQRSLQVFYRLNAEQPLVVRCFIDAKPGANSRELGKG